MYGLLVLIVIILIVVFLAIVLFSLNARRDRGDAAGEMETPEAPGSFYGEAPAPTRPRGRGAGMAAGARALPGEERPDLASGVV